MYENLTISGHVANDRSQYLIKHCDTKESAFNAQLKSGQKYIQHEDR